MFDVPELDHMVCVQLGSLELFQCSQVNSSWYDIVMPYLWTTIPLLKTRRQQQSLRRLVLIDYIQERQRRQQLKEEEEEEDEEEGDECSRYTGPSRLPPVQPTLLEEYGHLRCPNIKVPVLNLQSADLLSRVQISAIAKSVVPLAQTLAIGPEVVGGRLVKLSVIRQVLSATSGQLSVLCLRLKGYLDDTMDCGEAYAWKSPGAHFSNLKQLHLVAIHDGNTDNSAVSNFWAELWDHCRRIELLCVNQVPPLIFDTLVKGVSAMQNLDRIIVGGDFVSHRALNDDHRLAALIAAGKKGWKQVQNDSKIRLGGLSLFTLLQHSATLEELSIVQHVGGTGVITFLSVCPKLCSFSVRETVLPAPQDDTLSDINIAHFIDWDSTTKILNPWACESTLTVLRIWVDGIPLTDDEVYPGQRQILITATFERLARLVNLQELALGYAPLVPEGQDFELEPVFLEMTLACGLKRLEGLKSSKSRDLTHSCIHLPKLST
ncbi:hypothetical protein BG000_010679 [Podila horticola]|nr:hypothetical protein BG000_010679 [Podila horticola]